MGCCVSAAVKAGKVKPDQKDKQIKEGSEWCWYKRECKILLLGSSESGKSTIAKQMKIVYQGGFSDAELAEYRSTIYDNVLDSAQAVIGHMRKIGLECTESGNRELTEKILDYKLISAPRSSAGDPSFPSEIADAIDRVWKDPIVRNALAQCSSDVYLMDNATYFLDEVLRIGKPGYLPTGTDVLWARKKSPGIEETRFMMGALSTHMSIIRGQRCEPEKLIQCFKDVTSLIFCTALSAYDEVLLEEKTENRMAESLVLFESVVNSRWFLRTSIILVFTKIDIFKNKLPNVPLGSYFPEYTGGTDSRKATRYILWKFMQANHARLDVYPHLMWVTDTTRVRLIHEVLKETILQNALKDSKLGML